MFIDEVQNLTHHEVKSIVSRAGVGTKVILAGDPYQIDSPYLDFSSNGLTVTAEKMKDQPIAGSVFLDRSERSELAKIAATIL
jgi:PhoH-like ATPase